MNYEPLETPFSKEVVRATKQTNPMPGVTYACVRLVLMSDGAIMKRQERRFAKKQGQLEGEWKVFPWRVKRQALSFPRVSKEEFVDNLKEKGYTIEEPS